MRTSSSTVALPNPACFISVSLWLIYLCELMPAL
jgi:hypothetical protein